MDTSRSSYRSSSGLGGSTSASPPAFKFAVKSPGLGKSLDGLSLSDRKIIIAIDFGTTFSGVAWAETRRVSINPYIRYNLIIKAGTSQIIQP
jgi:hypothetical protein